MATYNAEEGVFNNQRMEPVFVLGDQIDSYRTAEGLAVRDEFGVFQDGVSLNIAQNGLPRTQPINTRQRNFPLP